MRQFTLEQLIHNDTKEEDEVNDKEEKDQKEKDQGETQTWDGMLLYYDFFCLIFPPFFFWFNLI